MTAVLYVVLFWRVRRHDFENDCDLVLLLLFLFVRGQIDLGELKLILTAFKIWNSQYLNLKLKLKIPNPNILRFEFLDLNIDVDLNLKTKMFLKFTII